MPRIAAATAVVITVVACVVFNTVRYPATLAMFAGDTRTTQSEQSTESDSSNPTDAQITEPPSDKDTFGQASQRYESFHQANELTWKAEPTQPTYENSETEWDDTDESSDPWSENDDSLAQDTSETVDEDSDEHRFQYETDDWNDHESESVTPERESWATNDLDQPPHSDQSQPIHASASGRYAARLDGTGLSESFPRDEIERKPSDWTTSRESLPNQRPSWESSNSGGRGLGSTIAIPRAARSERADEWETRENRLHRSPEATGRVSATEYSLPSDSWNTRTRTEEPARVRPLPPVGQISQTRPRSSYQSASTGQIPIYPSTAY